MFERGPMEILPGFKLDLAEILGRLAWDNLPVRCNLRGLGADVQGLREPPETGVRPE